jgi:GNAT superfamily N-acetyltransferase
MKLHIRPLQQADLTALLPLYRALHPADAESPAASVDAAWQLMLADPKIHLLGGLAGNDLVCSCMLLIVPNLTRGCRPFGLIENVVTAAHYRRQGLGRQLLQHAQNLAWAANCYKLMRQTSRVDAATFAFYEACGFTRNAKQAFVARPI